jgi:uncharacterized protein (TIGR00369 family)
LYDNGGLTHLTQLTFEQSAEFLKTIPFNELLGLRLLRFHTDGVTIGCTMRPELRNAMGVLHGGVSATLADVAVGVAVTRHLGRLRSATTVELKKDQLSAAGGRRQGYCAGAPGAGREESLYCARGCVQWIEGSGRSRAGDLYDFEVGGRPLPCGLLN